jgi:hypothetical protein
MEPVIKSIARAQAEDFLGAPRFNDNQKSEWHIISTSHPDHIGDVMRYNQVELPPSGKAIALLNHNEYFTGGLPLGKVLEYKVVQGPDGVDQLWQHTQYLPDLPDNIGLKTYEARKIKAFTDSSIQFAPPGNFKDGWPEGSVAPVREEDKGKDKYEWKGWEYLRWQLLEAGPVLMGMNWDTGNMKAMRKSILDALKQSLDSGAIIKIIPEKRLRLIAADEPIIKVIH